MLSNTFFLLSRINNSLFYKAVQIASCVADSIMNFRCVVTWSSWRTADATKCNHLVFFPSTQHFCDLLSSLSVPQTPSTYTRPNVTILLGHFFQKAKGTASTNFALLFSFDFCKFLYQFSCSWRGTTSVSFVISSVVFSQSRIDSSSVSVEGNGMVTIQWSRRIFAAGLF